MSQTDLPPTEPPIRTAPESCPRCGAPLRPDQDWCLDCGAAVTTEVAGAPAWRTPIAIVGAVLAVAAVALVLAFLELSDDSEPVAQAPATTATPPPAATTPAPTDTAIPGLTPTPTTTAPAGTGTPTPTATTDATPTPTATPDTGSNAGAFSDWPAGETAYTVVLWSAGSREEAETKAKQFQDAGQTVGILRSGDYSTLRPGYWVVFSGQYEDEGPAQDAARAAESTAPGAYVRRVKPK